MESWEAAAGCAWLPVRRMNRELLVRLHLDVLDEGFDRIAAGEIANWPLAQARQMAARTAGYAAISAMAALRAPNGTPSSVEASATRQSSSSWQITQISVPTRSCRLCSTSLL